ncbi:DUF2892 domain-containing protein [Archaeoglobales archaeon]|nr:MAG: DUF2892 domain-containing protein [Archaeoglobales archaeon]
MDVKRLILEENVGGYDLLIRSLAGTLSIIALAMDLVDNSWKWLFALIAFVGIYTSLTRHCTLYSFIGFSTKKID